MLTVYAYSIFNIQNIKSISEFKTPNVGNIFQIVHQLFFGTLIFLIFGVLVIGLVFVMLLRAMHLWIITMFSPLLSIAIVLKKDK